MAKRVSIGVTASGGEEVRVDYALSTDGVTPPLATSQEWIPLSRLPTSLLPAVFQTSPIPPPWFVWSRASGWTAGKRVTNYSTPKVVEIVEVPIFLELILAFSAAGAPVLRWAANALTEGVRITWAVHFPQDAPVFGAPTDREASVGEFEIPASVPGGRILTVRAEPWSGWDAMESEVAGDLGDASTRELAGAALGTADLGCRLVFTDTLDLVLTEDLCLVTTETP